VTGFDKGLAASTHTMARLHDFSPLLDLYINELAIHVCIIAIGSLVCFSWDLFLEPVWGAQMLGWSSNGSGVTRKLGTHLAGNHHMTGQKAWPSNWLLFVISRA